MLYVLYIKLKLRFQSFIWCRSASRANRCPIFSSPLKIKNLKFFSHIYVVKIFFCILFFVKFFFHLLILQQLNYLKKYFKVIFVLYFFINNLLNFTYRTSIFQTRLHTLTLTSSRSKNNEVMRLKFQEINTHIYFNILCIISSKSDDMPKPIYCRGYYEVVSLCVLPNNCTTRRWWTLCIKTCI